MFFWVKMGLVGAWLVIIFILVAMWAAFQYSGNTYAAQTTAKALSYVLVAYGFYSVGKFKGIGIGQRIGARPHHIQYALDAEHSDWYNEIQASDQPLKEHAGEVSFTSDLRGVEAICSSAFERIQRAIASFPSRYPEYQTRKPKLDADIRHWLSESGLAVNESEKRVFGTIIVEHFKL